MIYTFKKAFKSFVWKHKLFIYKNINSTWNVSQQKSLETFQESLCLSRMFIFCVVTTKHFFLFPPAVKDWKTAFLKFLLLFQKLLCSHHHFQIISNLSLAGSTTPLKVKPFEYWLQIPLDKPLINTDDIPHSIDTDRFFPLFQEPP